MAQWSPPLPWSMLWNGPVAWVCSDRARSTLTSLTPWVSSPPWWRCPPDRPDLRLVLLDAMEKRTALLNDAVAAMGVTDRVRVVTGRAELLGRDPDLRGAADAVTARSFGPPAATAECAAPLLQVGGLLVVSEPPTGPDRWPVDHLAQLGLEPSDVTVDGMKLLRQMSLCPDQYPRRDGLPAKRPLF
jgi:16S rRNA (guanine527-N7)-methyltransferase